MRAQVNEQSAPQKGILRQRLGYQVAFDTPIPAITSVAYHEVESVLDGLEAEQWWRIGWPAFWFLLGLAILRRLLLVRFIIANPSVSVVNETQLQGLSDADGKSNVFDEVKTGGVTSEK